MPADYPVYRNSDADVANLVQLIGELGLEQKVAHNAAIYTDDDGNVVTGQQFLDNINHAMDDITKNKSSKAWENLYDALDHAVMENPPASFGNNADLQRWGLSNTARMLRGRMDGMMRQDWRRDVIEAVNNYGNSHEKFNLTCYETAVCVDPYTFGSTEALSKYNDDLTLESSIAEDAAEEELPEIESEQKGILDKMDNLNKLYPNLATENEKYNKNYETLKNEISELETLVNQKTESLEQDMKNYKEQQEKLDKEEVQVGVRSNEVVVDEGGRLLQTEGASMSVDDRIKVLEEKLDKVNSAPKKSNDHVIQDQKRAIMMLRLRDEFADFHDSIVGDLRNAIPKGVNIDRSDYDRMIYLGRNAKDPALLTEEDRKPTKHELAAANMNATFKKQIMQFENMCANDTSLCKFRPSESMSIKDLEKLCDDAYNYTLKEAQLCVRDNKEVQDIIDAHNELRGLRQQQKNIDPALLAALSKTRAAGEDAYYSVDSVGKQKQVTKEYIPTPEEQLERNKKALQAKKDLLAEMEGKRNELNQAKKTMDELSNRNVELETRKQNIEIAVKNAEQKKQYYDAVDARVNEVYGEWDNMVQARRSAEQATSFDGPNGKSTRQSICDTAEQLLSVESVGKRANHQNTNEYTQMINAVQALKEQGAEGVPGKNANEQMEEKLNAIKDAAQNYLDRKHSQFAPFPSTQRKLRLAYAENLLEFVKNSQEQLKSDAAFVEKQKQSAGRITESAFDGRASEDPGDLLKNEVAPMAKNLCWSAKNQPKPLEVVNGFNKQREPIMAPKQEPQLAINQVKPPELGLN